MLQGRGRTGLAAAVVLLVGLGLGLGLARLLSQPPRPEASVESLALPDSQAARTTPSRPDAAQPPQGGQGTGAPEARQAVAAFLKAEADGDYTSSYYLLSRTDQRAYGSAQDWVEAHADLLPITGHRITGGSADSDRATVRTVTRMRATLDEFVGLVPARADVRWPVVRGGDGWRVRYGDAVVRPMLPSGEGIPDAVRAWVTDRIACGSSSHELAGGLLGAPGLADQLCAADGEVTLGPVRRLDGPADATPFVDAFGADAFGWTRTVQLDAPVALRAVVAPVGADWRVIGVLQATTR